jgi:hypothetical protein
VPKRPSNFRNAMKYEEMKNAIGNTFTSSHSHFKLTDGQDGRLGGSTLSAGLLAQMRTRTEIVKQDYRDRAYVGPVAILYNGFGDPITVPEHLVWCVSIDETERERAQDMWHFVFQRFQAAGVTHPVLCPAGMDEIFPNLADVAAGLCTTLKGNAYGARVVFVSCYTTTVYETYKAHLARCACPVPIVCTMVHDMLDIAAGLCDHLPTASALPGILNLSPKLNMGLALDYNQRNSATAQLVDVLAVRTTLLLQRH